MGCRHYLKTLFAVAFVLFSSVLYAQKQRLLVQSNRAGLFIDHKVSTGESFNSIATIYNLSPDTLAEFNNMDFYDGALIAKSIQVPLKTKNFYQRGAVDSTENLVPVYYVATSTQTIQQISSRHNKVPVAVLNKWNGIPKGGIVRGMQLLVGFLRVKPDQLAFFEDTVALDIAMVEKPVVPKVKPVKPQLNADSGTVVLKIDKPKAASKTVKEKKEPAELMPEAEAMVYSGFFKSIYKPSQPAERKVKGNASIFISKTGWNDGKYYVLIPRLKPGSIVKITSANKTVFAKVLGNMPRMSDSSNLLLRLSNSAATELGVTGNQFPVVVSY